MAVSNENVRTLITIPKELKAKLEEQARKEHRSFSELVRHILLEYIEENG